MSKEHNCYTFDASTGVLTKKLQLERHHTLQVPIEEHNGAKKKVRACPHNPPKKFCPQSLMLHSADLEGGKIVHSDKPNGVLVHIVNSHKIKPLKDSHRDVTILGSLTGLAKISNSHGVIVHNPDGKKWHLYADRHTSSLVAAAA